VSDWDRLDAVWGVEIVECDAGGTPRRTWPPDDFVSIRKMAAEIARAEARQVARPELGDKIKGNATIGYTVTLHDDDGVPCGIEHYRIVKFERGEEWQG